MYVCMLSKSVVSFKEKAQHAYEVAHMTYQIMNEQYNSVFII